MKKMGLHFNFIFDGIRLEHETILVGCIYRPNNLHDSEMCEIFCKARLLLKSKAYSGLILAGDFNFPRINWSRSGVPFGNHLNEADQSFIDIINDCFLYQNVYFPTFRSHEYSSTLDLIFTETGNRVIDIACGPALGAIEKAHQSIIWKYALKHDLRVSRLLNRPRYVYHTANFE